MPELVVEQMMLIHAGKILEDESTMQQLDIKDGDFVVATCKKPKAAKPSAAYEPPASAEAPAPARPSAPLGNTASTAPETAAAPAAAESPPPAAGAGEPAAAQQVSVAGPAPAAQAPLSQTEVGAAAMGQMVAPAAPKRDPLPARHAALVADAATARAEVLETAPPATPSVSSTAGAGYPAAAPARQLPSANGSAPAPGLARSVPLLARRAPLPGATPAPYFAQPPLPAADPTASAHLTPADEEVLARLIGLGFDRATCVEAYLKCQKNEDLAVSSLLEDIYAEDGKGAITPTRSTAAAPCAVREQHSDNATLLSGANPLEQLRSDPSFNELAKVVAEQPQMLDQLVEALELSDPNMAKAIRENREQFLQMARDTLNVKRLSPVEVMLAAARAAPQAAQQTLQPSAVQPPAVQLPAAQLLTPQTPSADPPTTQPAACTPAARVPAEQPRLPLQVQPPEQPSAQPPAAQPMPALVGRTGATPQASAAANAALARQAAAVAQTASPVQPVPRSASPPRQPLPVQAPAISVATAKDAQDAQPAEAPQVAHDVQRQPVPQARAAAGTLMTAGDEATVSRLAANLGFERDLVRDTFMACGRNEEVTASELFWVHDLQQTAQNDAEQMLRQEVLPEPSPVPWHAEGRWACFANARHYGDDLEHSGSCLEVEEAIQWAEEMPNCVGFTVDRWSDPPSVWFQSAVNEQDCVDQHDGFDLYIHRERFSNWVNQDDGMSGRVQQEPISLSPADEQAVQRLAGLGFTMEAALEAYLTCGRNEEYAGSLLFTDPSELMD
mmetsp:Transcript_73278/g.218682  ORF Transcript_73278/g.218682 Transcript_73278/m.218682 type:complete len:787 (-) Transcript_73278:150-2510(-)